MNVLCYISYSEPNYNSVFKTHVGKSGIKQVAAVSLKVI